MAAGQGERALRSLRRVVAPPMALISSMPLPVVSAPRPPRLVTCTLVVPPAMAVAPLRTSRSVALALVPSAVPRRSVPALVRVNARAHRAQDEEVHGEHPG